MDTLKIPDYLIGQLLSILRNEIEIKAFADEGANKRQLLKENKVDKEVLLEQILLHMKGDTYSTDCFRLQKKGDKLFVYRKKGGNTKLSDDLPET